MTSIHRSAIALLSERGFHGFGMRDVARGANLGVATLYHYVGDKETLVYRVLERTLDAAIASAEAAQAQGGTRERLRSLLTDHMRRVMAAPIEARLLNGAPLPLHEPQRRRIEALRQNYLTWVARTIDAAMRRKGERRAASERRTQLLLGMADRLAIDAAREQPGARPGRLAQEVLRVFFDGAQRPAPPKG